MFTLVLVFALEGRRFYFWDISSSHEANSNVTSKRYRGEFENEVEVKSNWIRKSNRSAIDSEIESKTAWISE